MQAAPHAVPNGAGQSAGAACALCLLLFSILLWGFPVLLTIGTRRSNSGATYSVHQRQVMLTKGSDQIQITCRLLNKLLSQVCCVWVPSRKGV